MPPSEDPGEAERVASDRRQFLELVRATKEIADENVRLRKALAEACKPGDDGPPGLPAVDAKDDPRFRDVAWRARELRKALAVVTRFQEERDGRNWAAMSEAGRREHNDLWDTIEAGLKAIPGLLAQAKGNLTGNQRDIWVWGTRSLKQQSTELGDVAKTAPASLKASLAAAKKATPAKKASPAKKTAAKKATAKKAQ